MDDIQVIKNIINNNLDLDTHKVFIFGSRAMGTADKYSDYDIGIEGSAVDAVTYFNIQSELEESDLPVKVDLVDFNDVSDAFKKEAKNSIISLNY